MTGSHLRPAQLAYMDRLLAAIRAGDADAAYHVYHLLDGYIFGFALWEIAYMSLPLDADAVTKVMQAIPGTHTRSSPSIATST